VTASDSPPGRPSRSSLADYQAIVARGLSGALGIRLLDVSDDRVVATMPVDDRTQQPFGALHGGASMTLAETAASLGAWSGIDPERFAAFAVELNASLLRSVRHGVVTAVATRVHHGRASQVWSVEIRDDAERVVCIARCTMAVVAIDRGGAT
jgi:1,4-dihydroxy-2-naphthoyl-CoA hydrolase